MTKIAIIIGSTRPGRKGDAVARWVHDIATKRQDAEFELVDIKDFDLPLLDEPVPPSMGQYSQPHTKAWAAKIDSFDALRLRDARVQPRHLRRAEERDRLPVRGVEQQGGRLRQLRQRGGTRAVEHLRLVMAEVQVADVRNQVVLSLFTDFENFTVFKPAARQEDAVTAMLDQVIAWGGALQPLRQ